MAHGPVRFATGKRPNPPRGGGAGDTEHRGIPVPGTDPAAEPPSQSQCRAGRGAGWSGVSPGGRNKGRGPAVTPQVLHGAGRWQSRQQVQQNETNNK